MAESRYFLIDPGFEDFDSHHGVVAEALIRDVISNGDTITVFASQKLVSPVGGLEKTITPFFSTPCYTNDLKPLAAAKENELAERFQAELSDIFLRYKINKNDVVVVHTGFSHLFVGLAKYLSGIPRLDVPKLIACGMFDPGISCLSCSDEVLRSLWFIKNKLSLSFLVSSVPADRLIFATSCNEYKIGYEVFMNCPVLIHPAINFQYPKQLDDRSQRKKRLLLFVGSVKQGKGIDFILCNLERLFGAFPNVDFVLHWNTNSPGIREYKDVEPKLHSLVNSFNNFEVLFGTLSTEQYESLFDSVQGVVASYMPSLYKYKTSGIFWDVLARSHCDLLCSKDTWLERESYFMGERAYFFDYDDIDSMIRAINEWELSEDMVDKNPTHYKKVICKSFSEWILSCFDV